MTDLSFDEKRSLTRVAVDRAARQPDAVVIIQDSDEIGCAPPPGTLRHLAQRLSRSRSWRHALPGHGWGDVAAAWILMAVGAVVLAGCLSLRGPEPPASAGYRLPSWVDTQPATD
ncbi:MAG TPA: hypothetical protein VMU85_08680 [Stellaceae bacterium]|nr:hypothetical protein [Stellaceae bacterium]